MKNPKNKVTNMLLPIEIGQHQVKNDEATYVNLSSFLLITNIRIKE